MSARWTVLTACVAAGALTTATTDAANCALRNPDRQIYDIFPDATSYRSVVEQVGIDLRPVIEERLGGALAFGDLGKHTVYVVFRDAVPLGFVHARSELGAHGSVELVWAIDLDMRIREFRVQRSREKHTDAIRTSAFHRQLIGKSAGQLASLLPDSNAPRNKAAIQVSAAAAAIARIAVLSGAKTLIITNIAFRGIIMQSRLLGNIHKAFPQTRKVTEVKDPMNAKALAIIKRRTGSSARLIGKSSLRILRSLDESGTTLGALAVLLPSSELSGPEQWWAIAGDGRISKVWMVGHTNDFSHLSLSEFTGIGLGDIVELASATGDATANYGVEVLGALAAAGIGP